MKNPPIRVAVTGAAGNIGYALLFRIASGAMFGPDQPVALNLVEIEPGMGALKGVAMELDDCAFPLLTEIVQTSDLSVGFKDIDWALLVGSVPRKQGMERADLLGINGKVFVGQGKAINASLVDLGNRFRFLVNDVDSVEIEHEMPKLPVARVLWDDKPNLQTAAEAWIQAGGAHHTAFSFDVSAEQIALLAEMAGVECIFIDDGTEMRSFKQDIRVGEVYYGIRGI